MVPAPSICADNIRFLRDATGDDTRWKYPEKDDGKAAAARRGDVCGII